VGQVLAQIKLCSQKISGDFLTPSTANVPIAPLLSVGNEQAFARRGDNFLT
jgi:hypothetical protein